MSEEKKGLFGGGEVAKRERDATAQGDAFVGRQAQEVQAAMVVAKKYPRNQVDAYNRIIQACSRKGLAEESVYEYPRGGTKVTGPSIRLAEVLAQNWGNLDFGIIELERSGQSSNMMAYCWDLETNTRQTKVFNVKHWRDTKQGGKALVDERDIYEITANQGARRLRGCVLGIIPKDIVDDAMKECEKTMASGEKEPLSDRIRKMLTTFKCEFNVSKEMVEARFQHTAESISESEMVSLKKIYLSLRDKMSKPEDHFERPKTSKFEAVSSAQDAEIVGDGDDLPMGSGKK